MYIYFCEWEKGLIKFGLFKIKTMAKMPLLDEFSSHYNVVFRFPVQAWGSTEYRLI